MTTITKDIGRGDFILHRYNDERIGCRWTQEVPEGSEPKDLTGWQAALTLESDMGEKLAEIECTCTSDGYVFANIPVETLISEAFAAYTFGRWRIVGTDGGSTELIAAGNFTVA